MFKLLLKKINFPFYISIAGQFYKEGSFYKNNLRYRIENTNITEFYNYVDDLIKNSFINVYNNDIECDNGIYKDKNQFKLFVKNNIYVYLFFNAFSNTLFITIDKGGNIPVKYEGDIRFVPKLTQMPNLYMCYVIQVDDGKFIVIDGDCSTEDKSKILYDFLIENTSFGKPQILNWFITHSHSDHITLAISFSKSYSALVDVNAFTYQFPNANKITVTMESNKEIKNDVKSFKLAVSKFYPLATIYTAHTGQKYLYNGNVIEILYSPDDTYPSTYISVNNLSLVLRVKFLSGKTALFLGDVMQNSCRDLYFTYGYSLKSDVLQLAHHGKIGGDVTLYSVVDPDICFWPTSLDSFNGNTNSKFKWCLGEGGCKYNEYIKDEKFKKRTHYTVSELTTLEM